MFTGIVQDVGRIAAIERRGGDVRLRVEVDRLSLDACRDGDSVAVGGVCLTVLDVGPRGFAADVSIETLTHTTLGDAAEGDRVNLEPALRAGDALGGHLVSGHVDGIGRVDLVENRLVGMKSRGVYETPGGTILLAGLRELESLCLDRESAHYKEVLAHKYAEIVYFGQWFTPLRAALDAFVESLMAPVSGTARFKLYKGNLIVAGRTATQSLYQPNLASFTMGAGYDQRDAAGFINILGLPLQVEALMRKDRGQS